MSANDEMTDYLTAKQEASFRRQEASYDQRQEKAQKLLNLLLAGIGGATMLFFAVDGTPERWGLVVMVAGWFVCASYLLTTNIVPKKRPTLFTSPEYLFYDDENTGEKVTLATLKRVRIWYVKGYLDDLTAINIGAAKRLIKAFYGAALPPVAGVIAYLVSLSA